VPSGVAHDANITGRPSRARPRRNGCGMDPRIAVRTHSTDSEARLPLATLLSFVLVAYTIEFDNAFEPLMPHRTTRHGTTDDASWAPWLVSLVEWADAMQYVAAPARQLASRRAKGLVLTSEGRLARAQYRGLLAALEERWMARYGAELVRELRASLKAVTGSDGAPALFDGLEPPPGGWRAELPRAACPQPCPVPGGSGGRG
jgi:hypothetical protein